MGVDLRSIVAQVYLRAALTEQLRFFISGQIGGDDAMPQIQEKMSQPTHATAPCSDEINQ